MKKRFMVLSLLVSTLILGAVTLFSSPGLAAGPPTPAPPAMTNPMGPRANMGHGNRFALMAELLGLSANQQQQIKAVLRGHRHQGSHLFRELRNNERQLRRIAMTAPFDAKAARALELKQADLRTRRLADRAEIRGKIDAILTPAQRQTAKILRELMHERHGRHMAKRGDGPRRGATMRGD